MKPYKQRVKQTSLWCGRCCQQGSFRHIGTRGCPSQLDLFFLDAASPPEATLQRSPLPTASTSCAVFAPCHTDVTLPQGNLPTSLLKHELIKNNNRHTKAGREKPMRPQPYTKSDNSEGRRNSLPIGYPIPSAQPWKHPYKQHCIDWAGYTMYKMHMHIITTKREAINFKESKEQWYGRVWRDEKESVKCYNYIIISKFF